MGDLISRQALQDKLKNISDMYTLDEEARIVLETIVRIVTEQPTAYDVEEVLAELETASVSTTIIIGSHKINRKVINADRAISIVKAGEIDG